MFDWVLSLQGLLVAVVSSVLVSAGYLIRARIDNRKNRKLALYSLLEIWHRLSVFYIDDFDPIFDRIMREMQRHFPLEDFSSSSTADAKAAINPILLRISREAALSDVDGYSDSYQGAIQLVASDDPILAYRFSSASSTKKLLGMMDDYFESVLSTLETTSSEGSLFGTMRDTVTNRLLAESIKGLEADIRRLSWKISLGTFVESCMAIRRRKKNLEESDDPLIKDLVAGILVAAVKKHVQMTQPDGSGP